MKLLFLVYIIFSLNYTVAQQNNTTPFSSFQFGLLSGVNFEKSSKLGGNVHFELQTNILSDFQMLFSIGYFRTIEPVNYNVKTFDKISLNNYVYYRAVSYKVVNNNYDVFPFSIGFQYILKNKILSPYFLTNLNYNLIDSKTEIISGEVWSFNTFEEMPAEFKNSIINVAPDNYFSAGIGIGTVYNLNKNIALDVRYFFTVNKETVNTHNLLIGLFL